MSERVAQKTRQLVTLAKQGDEPALDRLCIVYAERIRRIVRLRMGPELRSQLDSMDLVQEALMAAVRDIGDFTYRSEGDFLRWLSQIAENKIRNNVARMHAAKRDVRREIVADDRDAPIGAPQGRGGCRVVTTTPSVVLLRRDELDKLERAMDQLKPPYRQVILLAKIEGLSHKETAIKMNTSPTAVAMLLSRAIVALTDAYKRL
jgi:RNA polymerase sigma-70 factor (subfamily 1)